MRCFLALRANGVDFPLQSGVWSLESGVQPLGFLENNPLGFWTITRWVFWDDRRGPHFPGKFPCNVMCFQFLALP